jgi:hypothetical protein
MVFKIKSQIDATTRLLSPKFGFWSKAPPNGILSREVHVNLMGSLIKIRWAVTTRGSFAQRQERANVVKDNIIRASPLVFSM